MLSFALKRFPHWTPAKHSGNKYKKNHQLNLKHRVPQLKSHDNIIFKNYTGNEILHSFKHVSELRPSEISGGLIELLHRPGAPQGYDWNENERIKQVVNFTKTRIPQYTSRVVTSLAYAFHRLGINDEQLWKNLSKSVLKFGNNIESRGLAYAWACFVEKGCPEFYERSSRYLPNHLDVLNGRDLLFVIRGIVKENVEVGDMFDRHLVKMVMNKKLCFSVEQLQEMIQLASTRKEFDEEKIDLLQKALKHKIARREFRLKISPKIEESAETIQPDELKATA
jgi:hypothetical protein